MRQIVFVVVGVTVCGLNMAEHTTATETPVVAAPAPLSPAASAMVARWRTAVNEAAGTTASAPSLPIMENLKRRIAVEQAARKALPEWPNSGLSESDQEAAKKAIWDEIFRIDAENTAYLKSILPADGWFRIRRDGDQVATSAWLIVQHSPDLAFQRRVLDLMTPLVPAGEANGRQYALLYDRVALYEGRRQRYGSQVMCANGRFVPNPVEEPEMLDELRASVGLEPIAEYLRFWDGKRC